MSEDIIDKLLTSVDHLENTILHAYTKLSNQLDTPEEVVERLQQYRSICDQQRTHGQELRDLLARNDTAELTRRVKLINALSLMILEDVRVVLASIQGLSVEHTNESLH